MFAVNTRCPRFLAKILPLFSKSNVSYRQPSTKIKFARPDDSTWVRITAAKSACPELGAFGQVPAVGSSRTKPILVPFRRETPRLPLPRSSRESDPFITKDSVRRTNWKILQRRFPISRETRATSSNCTRHRETRRFRRRQSVARVPRSSAIRT